MLPWVCLVVEVTTSPSRLSQVDAPSCKIHGINCMAYYLIVGYSVVFVLTLAAGVFYRFRQSRSSAGGRMRRGRGGTYSQLG